MTNPIQKLDLVSENDRDQHTIACQQPLSSDKLVGPSKHGPLKPWAPIQIILHPRNTIMGEVAGKHPLIKAVYADLTVPIA